MGLKRICFYTVLLASLVAAGQWIRNRSEETGTVDDTNPDIWTIKEDSIQSIEIRLFNPDRGITFVKNPLDEWHIGNCYGKKTDPKRWGGIVTLVSGPRSKRLIGEKTGNIDHFGLNQPEMVVTVHGGHTRQRLKILVGSTTPDKKSVYVRIKGHGAVYLLDHTWRDVLMRLVTSPPELQEKPRITANGQSRSSLV